MRETVFCTENPGENNDVIIVPGRSQRRPTRRILPAADVIIVEKLLGNGDLYTGTFRDRVPHGVGKYLWADGCMYEGEWRRGEASGKGKFSWPSGATYEGQFKDGRMDGYGAYIGADGDSYRGSWAADQKHGFGEKSYANGDMYVGMWKRNVMDGEGRYVWSSGNEYIGEWQNGVMSGKGVLIWANGKRYEGQWVDGVPKGNGVFTWPDGRILHTSGSWAPSNHGVEVVGGSEIRGQRRFWGSVGERNLNLPRICIWELDGEAGDITCDIVDNVGTPMYDDDPRSDSGTEEGLEEDGNVIPEKTPQASDGNRVKKPGHLVAKGDKNYELIINLQLGIRYSTEKNAEVKREITQSDFDPNEKFWTRFPAEGSKNTPPHQTPEFRWKDYCPVVFKCLRESFRIDSFDYMRAICGNDALRELSSPGKSGSLFYITDDERFMIKTMKKSDLKVLIKMLPTYYEHICLQKNSLIAKFLGVHCVKQVGGQKVRFVVMENLFYSKYGVHKRFDLKGSSYGRTIDMTEAEIDETTTLKDLDLNFVFLLDRPYFAELIRQIDRDCQFLEAANVMDYSLLIGVHFCHNSDANQMDISALNDYSGRRDAQECREAMLPDKMSRGGLHGNLPARAKQVPRELDNRVEGIGSRLASNHADEIFNVILCLGIIDILQEYDISKKLEYAYKSWQVDPSSLSVADPKLYSKRFRDFVNRIFVEYEEE